LLGCIGFALGVGFAGFVWVMPQGVGRQSGGLHNVAKVAPGLVAIGQELAPLGSDR
jgi:ABC-type transport system involved in cytochrome c biogenesis permease component